MCCESWGREKRRVGEAVGEILGRGRSWNYGTEYTREDRCTSQVYLLYIQTLKVYKNKSRIQEKIYSNNFGTVLLFRYQTNMKLNCGRRYQGGEVECAGQWVSWGDIGQFLEVMQWAEACENLTWSEGGGVAVWQPEWDEMKIEKWRKYIEELWRERMVATNEKQQSWCGMQSRKRRMKKTCIERLSRRGGTIT